MSPNPNPEIAPGRSEAAQGESEARDALRDRIADALYQWTLSVAAPRSTRPPYLDPRTEERLRENSLARANAVMPVFEAAIERAEQQGWQDADEAIIRPERAMHEETIRRAEQAEAIVERIGQLRDKWLAWPTDSEHHAAGLMLARWLEHDPEAAP